MFGLIGFLLGLIVALFLFALVLAFCVSIVFAVAVVIGVITDKKNWAIRVMERWSM